MDGFRILVFGTLAAIAALTPSLFGAEAAPAVPAWADRQIAEAVARYKAWKGADETVAFVMTTDVHSYKDGISDPPDYGDPKMHLPFAVRCADLIGADFAADLGDQDLEWGARHGGVEGLDRRIRDVVRLYGGGLKRRPLLCCVGNHEHCWEAKPVPGRIPVTNRQFGEAFNALSVKAGHKVTLSDDMSWGYYDVPGKKTRVFFLNTSDGNLYYGLSPEQLKFVVEGLSALPSGAQAAVLLHFCISPSVGGTYGCYSCTCKNADVLIRIVEDFVWRAKGEALGVTWDFTQADGLFAGFFCGDAHTSNQGMRNYIPYTLSQGYGYSSRAPYGGTSLSFDRANTCCFEIVAFKLSKSEAHVFRVGAGGAAADRAYRYDRAGIERAKRW